MGVEARELDGGGVVLVCTTSNVPLTVSINAFSSVDDAERFLVWLGRDARLLGVEELNAKARGWWAAQVILRAGEEAAVSK